jgi:hypothetical protein
MPLEALPEDSETEPLWPPDPLSADDSDTEPLSRDFEAPLRI